MDLFGDLPEPSKDGQSLYDDLSVQSQTVKGASGPQKRNADSADLSSTHDDKTSKIKTSVKFKLKGFYKERRGEREEMQDAHVIIDDYTKEFSKLDPSVYRLAIFAVYDGHAGSRASRFASENLHKYLRDKFPKGDVTTIEKDIKKILIETFKKTDDDFLKQATKSKPVWKDGTTATVILAINDTLYIASLGDSQAFLCRYKEETKKCSPIHLTTVHDPSLYEERIRIQKAGGHVQEGRVMGALEVSRSIGDGPYKNHGVSCVPDVKKCQLTQGDRYIVLACDGLWKKFKPEDCLAFTNKILEDSTIQGTDDKSTDDLRYETACNKLANEAVLRLSADNVTVLIIAIQPNK
ncbi:integrin-linked kinase-associated serine/threonine phosphatase 2C-like [Mytilus trossulus]|uniref:integrin-linked kinase-associated serine/threonine phosphatase 2C-like n=1 Tax=Mytilus trossulus TaxID=6551 RepID=UPI003006521B